MEKIGNGEVKYDLSIEVSSLEHVVIKAKLGDIIGFQIIQIAAISNNPSFRLKHAGVPNGSDGSDGTLYPLTENYTLPVAQATGRVPYLPPSLCSWNAVTYTHNHNDTYVTLFTGVAVML